VSKCPKVLLERTEKCRGLTQGRRPHGRHLREAPTVTSFDFKVAQVPGYEGTRHGTIIPGPELTSLVLAVTRIASAAPGIPATRFHLGDSP